MGEDQQMRYSWNTKMWDFSIMTAINMSVMIFLGVRICHINFQSAHKRNRLTFRILIWFFLNQVCVQVIEFTNMLIVTKSDMEDYFFRYCFQSIQMQVLATAALYQLLEWHSIAAMVKFQSSRHANFVIVQRDSFQKQERARWRNLVCYLWITASYNATKVVFTMILQLKCKQPINETCPKPLSILDSIVIGDLLLSIILFMYFFYVVVILLMRTYDSFRYEFKRHATAYSLMSVSIAACVPFDIVYVLQRQNGGSKFEHARLIYYMGFLVHSIPSILLIFARANEDCFNCYNRCAPQRFSVFQFSVEKLLQLRLDDDEEISFRRRTRSTQGSLPTTNRQSFQKKDSLFSKKRSLRLSEQYKSCQDISKYLRESQEQMEFDQQNNLNICNPSSSLGGFLASQSQCPEDDEVLQHIIEDNFLARTQTTFPQEETQSNPESENLQISEEGDSKRFSTEPPLYTYKRSSI